MIQFLSKIFVYKKIFDWLKERIEGLLFLIISIFLVSYFHSEYLDYIEFKNKSPESNVGLSFIIKNVLIFIIAIGYGCFYFLAKKVKQAIAKKEHNKVVENKRDEMVKNLDQFLDDEELKK